MPTIEDITDETSADKAMNILSGNKDKDSAKDTAADEVMRRMASEIPPNIRLELARLQTATDRGDTAEQESAKAAMGKLSSELPDKRKQKVVMAIQAVVMGTSKKAMAKIDEEKAAMEKAIKRKAIEEKVAAAKAAAAEVSWPL